MDLSFEIAVDLGAAERQQHETVVLKFGSEISDPARKEGLDIGFLAASENTQRGGIFVIVFTTHFVHAVEEDHQPSART